MTSHMRTGPGGDGAGQSPAGRRDNNHRTTTMRHGTGSARAHLIAAPDGADSRTMLDLAVRSCALRGCTCSPTVKVWLAEQYMRVEHEDRCAVLAGGDA